MAMMIKEERCLCVIVMMMMMMMMDIPNWID